MTLGEYIGKQFNNWTVIDIIDDKTALCQCTCGNVGNVPIYNLETGRSKSCGCSRYTKGDITGKRFGEYTVLKMLPDKKALCRCSCGKEREVYISNLKRGLQLSCGHSRKKDNIIGNKYGKLTVIDDVGDGKVLCRCDCGNTKEIWKKTLKNGTVRSCGCSKTPYADITGKQFGYWKVIRRIKDDKWECQCISCGSVQIQYKSHLLNGDTKSCGCRQGDIFKDTMIKTYGELSPLRISNPRQRWQIGTLNDKGRLREYIIGLGYKPTISDLCKRLDTQSATVLIRVHNAGLEDIVDIQPMHSKYEDEIIEFIKEFYNETIITNDRKLIAPYELDIYIPKLNIAIEFNGNYWHSDVVVDKNYHQQKTLLCRDKGIRLIHIFEYEWKNNNELIKKYIYNTISDNLNTVYARDTEFKIISEDQAKIFIDENHLQKYSVATGTLALMDKNEILEIMSISNKPRFANNIQFEIVRLCTKSGYRIIGGAEKLFKHFKNEINPRSVISYCDLSKFTGNIYNKLQFKLDGITKPNYIWVNDDLVLSRYQTQKDKLVKSGYGKSEQTEDEIMKNLGYLKIYNCGNARYVYVANE